MAEVEDPQEELCPVIQEWMKMPALVSRCAESGRIAAVQKGDLDRGDVSDNAELLNPLIGKFGVWSEKIPI